jgi:hypothetical protein
MSPRLAKAFWIAAPIAALALLGGCSYDYLQHSDRIAYNNGDAVKANLEAETTDPANKNAYSTGGLGKNGAQGSSEASAP